MALLQDALASPCYSAQPRLRPRHQTRTLNQANVLGLPVARQHLTAILTSLLQGEGQDFTARNVTSHAACICNPTGDANWQHQHGERFSKPLPRRQDHRAMRRGHAVIAQVAQVHDVDRGPENHAFEEKQKSPVSLPPPHSNNHPSTQQRTGSAPEAPPSPVSAQGSTNVGSSTWPPASPSAQSAPEHLPPGHLDGSTSHPTAADTSISIQASTTSQGMLKNKKAGKASSSGVSFSYAPAERDQIRESWVTLMRWSKVLKNKDIPSPLQQTRKVVVFGGGSFGTAVGCVLAQQKAEMDVVMLLRDPHLCKDINQQHCNTRYLKEFQLPKNVRATTSAFDAIHGAQFAVHAVPVQSSRAFLVGVRDLLPKEVPIICLSKGLELGTGLMMSELIPSALERKQPAVFLSGPSFAREVMENRPTGMVAASKDKNLNRIVQALFANRTLRVNTTSDVVGVEICGALKNVLAIAAGIVEGLDLGHNAMAALIAQGCSEIRWLSEKMGAKATTMSGLSGLGDIMLTCYGSLSRNRAVGIRLGKGERLEDILASSPQVAEGVATAGVVVTLAKKYRVSLPVLTAVAQVLDNALTPSEAVTHIMNLPQIEER